jgi:subtilase family serine protease
VKLGAAIAASATAAALGVGTATPAGASGITPHRMRVDPQISRHAFHPEAAGPDAVRFSCQSRPMDGSAGPRCYQPSQIQNAYDVTPLLDKGQNGAGRTIVVIDAYGSPTMSADLAQFNQVMGLPDSQLQIVAPFGVPAFDPNDDNQVGWGIETTLDVEWAHAIAPGANIVLALAKSNNDSDILDVQRYVVDHDLGDVVSQSFGEAEQCMDPTLLSQSHTVFQQAVAKGMTLFASSGDSGAAQPGCNPGDPALFAASTPASDPDVTGVGGTTLTADTSTGAYQGETAWTEPFGCNPPAVASTDVNCSGGGFSTVFSRPGFQNAVQKNAARGVPDVAYNAGVSGGVLIKCGFCNEIFAGAPADAPIFFIIGGTSAGTPQWSALTAIADQIAHQRLGSINPSLYSLAQAKKHYAAGFHDITAGNNDVAEIGGGYDAGTRWDPVTGLGSPDAAKLLPLLAQRG